MSNSLLDLSGFEERCIWYDITEHKFYEEGFIINNIYTEIHPIHVEIFKTTFEDMVIKDKHGVLTALWVM